MRKTVEHQLCRLHQRSYCHLVGNGTAGITLCLEALSLQNTPVALPDSVCLNVPLAVFNSGNRPAYLDVEVDDLCLSVKALKNHELALGAIIAVHGYGSVCRISEIERIAAQRGVPVIEDACLAQGGRLDSRPVGSFGIASVVSFGDGKPLSLGHGGAILTDDLNLYLAIRDLDLRLAPFSSAAATSLNQLSKAHTQLYNDHYGRDLGKHVEMFRRLAMAAAPHFLYRFDEARLPLLDEALDNLTREIESRWAKWERFYSLLEKAFSTRIKILVPPQGSVPWRLNLFLERRSEIMRAIHQQGMPASSWHPPVSMFLEMEKNSGERQAASRIGNELLNLWINSDVDNSYAPKVCNLMHSVLNSLPVEQTKNELSLG